MMISKKSILMTIVVVLVVVGVGFVIYKKNKENPYSVVYMMTGEVYVGKITTFPDMQLSNGYVLQVNKDATDPTKNTFQLQPISQAIWAPKVMHINQKNVVFYGQLLPTSKIVETLTTQKQ